MILVQGTTESVISPHSY